MARRVYVCEVIGRGTEADPQRPAIADVPSVRAWSALISTGPDGRKRFGWSICRVESTGFVGVGAVATRIPTSALGVALSLAELTAIRTRVPVDDVAISGTAREVLRTLVQAHYPDADEGAVL